MRVSCLHALLLLRLAWPVRGLESWEGKSQSTIGPTRSCGTPELTKQQRSDVEKVLSLVKIRGRKESTTGGYQANSRKVIPICFHVIGDRISRTSLQRDLDQLNEAFSASSCCNSTLYWCNGECSRPDPNIKFVMARSILGRVIGTTRAPTNSLACVQRRRQGPSMTPGGVGEIVIKSQMRVGDGRFLNIYYADLPEGLLGYSSIPSQLLVSPILDGVVVHRKARVGGNFTDFNMGKTLVHEVGHWLGNRHTFDGGCSPGDGVADTPAEAIPFTGCEPTMRDTCPFDPGRDPIFNYMNYGFDSCLFEWTQGQINIMHATIEYYRQASRRELASIELLSGVESDDVSLVEGVGRYFYMNVRNTSLIACQTFSDNGDIDIFANWDGKLNSFECISNGLDSRELCILGPDQGRIYLWVEAYSTTIDFTVKCSPITVRRREELFDNIAKQSICFSPNELQPYFFSTPDTALSFVKCETDGEGDPDLFLGNSDSIKDPVCESRTFGSAIEACQIGPLKGNISVWILSSDHSENVTIHCKATPLDGIELTSGVTSNTMNVLADEEITFYVHTGNDQPSMVYCTTTCDNGDLDLYMSWNRAALECVSASLASYEECEMGPDVGIALAYVYGYEDTFNFSITCSVDYIPVFVLSDGDVAGPFHVKLHEYKFFELFVPKPSFVTCSTTGLDGDLDLYMNYDGSASNHICSSETYSSNENCTIGRRSGKTYAYVYGNAPNTNFNITCSILDEDTNWL